MSTERIRRLALTITTTVCALALIVSLSSPVAFTIVVLVTAWVAAVAWALVTRSRLTDVRASLAASVTKLAASEAECVELARVAKLAAAEALQLDQENMRLHLELSEAQLLAGTVRVPSLRVVPNGGQS